MEQGENGVPVVYLHDVRRRYKQGEATLTILDGANLALWEGQSVALVAPLSALHWHANAPHHVPAALRPEFEHCVHAATLRRLARRPSTMH